MVNVRKKTGLDCGVGEGSLRRPDSGCGAHERRAEGRGRRRADIRGKMSQEREQRPPRGDKASSFKDTVRGQWGQSIAPWESDRAEDRKSGRTGLCRV